MESSDKPTRLKVHADSDGKPARLNLANAITTAAAPSIRPAVANALWPRLRLARQDPKTWVTPKLYIPMRSGAGGGIKTTTPPVPGPDEKYRWEILENEVQLYAFASRIKSRIGRAFTVKLFKTDHDRLLLMLDGLHLVDYLFEKLLNPRRTVESALELRRRNHTSGDDG